MIWYARMLVNTNKGLILKLKTRHYTRGARVRRANLRLSPEEYEVIEASAWAEGECFSYFVARAALKEAERVRRMLVKKEKAVKEEKKKV